MTKTGKLQNLFIAMIKLQVFNIKCKIVYYERHKNQNIETVIIFLTVQSVAEFKTNLYTLCDLNQLSCIIYA